jgi:sulfate adenylyltransferase subunit 2
LVHIDTGYEMPELIEYRDRLCREWRLDLVVGQNKEALAGGMGPEQGRVTCCTAMKIEALKQTIAKHKWTAVILGIRADEEGTRAKERYFSLRDKHGEWDFRDQPPELWDQFNTTFPAGSHIRVHPLLDWTELNIWEYLELENIPLPTLYFDRGNRTRYRSLGCVPCTGTVNSCASTIPQIITELRTTTSAERAGRAQDEGRGMETLRKLGHM